MKKIISVFLLFACVYSLAQKNFLEVRKSQVPTIFIDGALGNYKILQTEESKIESVNVIKGENTPTYKPEYKNFLQFGIIDVKMKKGKNLKTIPLYRLNSKNNLQKNNPIYVDGFLVSDNSMKIIKKSIIETEIVDSDNNKVVNIWTLTKDERNGWKPTPKSNSKSEIILR